MVAFINPAASALLQDPLFLYLPEADQEASAREAIAAIGADPSDMNVAIVLARALEMSGGAQPPPTPVAAPPPPENGHAVAVSPRLAEVAAARAAGDLPPEPKQRWAPTREYGDVTRYLVDVAGPLGMSDRQLGALMGTSRQSIYEWRTGTRPERLTPSQVETLATLIAQRAKILQKTLDTMIAKTQIA